MLTLLVAVVAVAVAAGSRAELVVGGAVIAAVNGVYALRLMYLAACGQLSSRSPSSSRSHSISRSHSGAASVGPRYSAGFLGVGMLAAATAGAAVGVSALGGAATAGAPLCLAALGVAACAYVPGMLMLPGAAPSTVARLRRGFDGLGVGVCLLFTAWLLVISPNGAIGGYGFWVSLVACGSLPVAVVCGLRAAQMRRGALAAQKSRGALACAAGAGLSIVGLAGLTLLVAGGGDRLLTAVFVGLLTVAPALAWLGLRSTEVPDEAGPLEVEGTFAGYPVLALPAAVAIVVALHRLATGGEFDRPSVILGIVGVAVVTLRETLAAMDVSRYARRVAEQEARFRSLVAGSTDVIMVLDGDLLVRWQSPASARQLGLCDQEVVGRHFQSMVHPEDAVSVADRLADVRAGHDVGSAGGHPALIEARLRDGFGHWRETESSVNDQRDVPEVGGLVVHIRDVSERKEMERTLHRLAFVDQLTGLANRRQMLASILAQRSAPRARGALLLLELDGFNAVNDARGYAVGDAVLVEVARRLRAGAGETDLPARLAGDEFAVVTEATSVKAYALAVRLLTKLGEPIALPGVNVHLTASIGMTDVAGGTSSDDVLRRADLALRRAKQLGRGRVEWFDEAVEQAIVARMTLEQELPEALVRGEMDLLYQPIVDLVGGRPVAVEALLRWRHPRLGTLLPGDVIPVAEELGLISDIGGWVLHQATRQLATWLQEGRDVSMAVNVSPRQLEGAELIEDIVAVLDLHELPPDRLILELAEGGFASDPGGVDEQLIRIRCLGVRTALDGFGTGPESLTRLRRLPMDLVKIGRSFFDETEALSGPSVPIIDAMVGLGRRLGFDVVAQGVETAAQLDVVRGAGCRLGQGHLFARPQPAEHIEAYLDSFPARSGG